MALTFTFPGQGRQSAGMGQRLADAFTSARAVFEDVDDALPQNLSVVMWDGPAENLTLTANSQPASMACSTAAMQVLKTENEKQTVAILAKILAGKLVAGQDIANAALYPASDEAAYITGLTLHINDDMAMI